MSMYCVYPTCARVYSAVLLIMHIPLVVPVYIVPASYTLGM